MVPERVSPGDGMTGNAFIYNSKSVMDSTGIFLLNRGRGRNLIPPPFERSTRRRGGYRALELKFIAHGPPMIMSHAMDVNSKKYSTSAKNPVNPLDIRWLTNI